VYKYSDHNKSYAGKIILDNLIPGYPDISDEDIKQFSKKIEHKSIKFACYNHPNIETFEAALQVSPDSPPILLSELLTENLDSFTMHMKGKCAVHKQLKLCHDMARGLQYLHSISVVHSNLHGRNILISYDGTAKIADYVCPHILPNSTKISLVNVPYLSPEAIEDKSHCTESSDIYSLGVLFLQVVIQKIPSPTDKTEYSKMMKRREELSEVKAHLLWSTILQCLSPVRLTRPSIEKLCEAVAAAKQAPQNVMSSSLEKTVSGV